MMGLVLMLAALVVEPRTDADAGVKAFAEGRYEDAARILGEAYRAEPEPELLFAWAQAERYAGHCEHAVPLFRDYLAGSPPVDVRGLAREAIEACGDDPDAPPPPEEPADAGAGDAADADTDARAPVAPVDPAGPDRPSNRVARDPLGHALTWSGVAVAAVGAGLLTDAHRRRSEAQGAGDEQGYRDALAGAPTLSRAGIAVLAGGAALVVAGVVRFAVLAGRRGRERSAMQPSGTGLVWKFELAPRRARALR